MALKSSNDNSAYESKIKLYLEKLKNGQVENVKTDLTKIKIKTLATQFDLLSNGIQLFMVSPSSNRHYALNDRTLNRLRKGKTDTNAIISGPDEPTFSDAEISELLGQEKEVILTVVKLKIDKQRPGGHSSLP